MTRALYLTPLLIIPALWWGFGAPEAEAPLGNTTLNQQQIIAEITELQAAQEAYFQKTGKYLQTDMKNPTKTADGKDLTAELGKALPTGFFMTQYETIDAEGNPVHGYEIHYTEGDTAYSIGYGPQAAERTYTVDVSTTTP